MKGYCRARKIFMHSRKFGVLDLPPAELGNSLNVLLLRQPPAPHCQNGLFFFSSGNEGIKLWLLLIWRVLSSNSTKLLQMGKRQQVEQYHWSPRGKNMNGKDWKQNQQACPPSLKLVTAKVQWIPHAVRVQKTTGYQPSSNGDDLPLLLTITMKVKGALLSIYWRWTAGFSLQLLSSLSQQVCESRGTGPTSLKHEEPCIFIGNNSAQNIRHQLWQRLIRTSMPG